MTISLKHRFCTISLLAMTLGLSGCASLVKPRLPDVFKDPPPPSGSNGTYTLGQFQKDFDAYNAKMPPLNPSPKPEDLTAATTLRNKMVYGVLAEIDYVYHNYEISLFMNEGSFRVATDTLALGLGVASTITNGERAKTVLSAALTGFTGATLSIDKNFFRQQTVQALISSMQAGRDRTKTIIIKHLNDDSASSYPFQAARSDMAAYFFAGTLPGALQELNQTAAASAKDERTKLTVTVQDVQNAKSINQTLAAELAANKLDKTVAFLTAMGVTLKDPKDKAEVEAAYRDLANRAVDDPVLKAKFYEEAKKAELYK
jgi:hypothetical protein